MTHSLEKNMSLSWGKSTRNLCRIWADAMQEKAGRTKQQESASAAITTAFVCVVWDMELSVANCSQQYK